MGIYRLIYSLFHAKIDIRKRCHLALWPDKSILKEVPGSKYAPILSCKISWGWDKNPALHNNWKLMSFFWMGGGKIITSDYRLRQLKIKIKLKSTSWPNEVYRHAPILNWSYERYLLMSLDIFLCNGLGSISLLKTRQCTKNSRFHAIWAV